MAFNSPTGWASVGLPIPFANYQVVKQGRRDELKGAYHFLTAFESAFWLRRFPAMSGRLRSGATVFEDARPRQSWAYHEEKHPPFHTLH